ncbi:hypothetical protein B2J86_02355 [Acidovorax sp. SRB_14]|uniref:flagellar hook-length control protein FliK n=1 Tax=Acidovorax sp. SRB_14 TaxID=1962699 RepID=UPI001567C54C|nr:flagellar hook-length control protein FliK [Acidovorax sp. SRB_14]NMM79780.1 hypothetical protein [Acidovorax sp. SRB_14]
MTIALPLSPAFAVAAAPLEPAPGTAQAFATAAPASAGAALFFETLQRAADPALWLPSAPGSSSEAALPVVPVSGTRPFDGFDKEQETEAAQLPTGAMAPLAMAQLADANMPVVALPTNLQRPLDPATTAATATAEQSAAAGALPNRTVPQAMSGPAQLSQAPLVPQEAPAAPQAPRVNAAKDLWSGSATLGPEAAAVREKSMALPLWLRETRVAPDPAQSDASDIPATAVSASATPRTDTRTPQALLETLGERIGWHVKRGSEHAVIRLDPPMHGQLEITIRRDSAGIQVHLSASSSEVVRQLQAISDGLRQDLMGRQTGEVMVVISHGARDSDGRERQKDSAPEQNAPGQALAEAESDQAPARFALHSPPY